jgi:hypothetical protein
MPSATSGAALTIRPHPRAQRPLPEQDQDSTHRKLKHRPCTSYSEPEGDFFLQNPHFRPVQHHPSSSYEARPAKRHMPSPAETIVVVNSSGRQAASFIRVASAVGYRVRAQLRTLDGIVANEISSLPNVTVVVGDLYTRKASSGSSPLGAHGNTGVNHDLINDLFQGAQLAFINTTFWGDEGASFIHVSPLPGRRMSLLFDHIYQVAAPAVQQPVRLFPAHCRTPSPFRPNRLCYITAPHVIPHRI